MKDVSPGRSALPYEFEVLPSAARTATPTAVEFGTTGASGLIIVINVSALTGTPSVVFNVEGVLYVNGVKITWTILASAAVVGTGTTVLRIHPDIAEVANTQADDLVPARVQVRPVHGTGDSITYSVTAELTP